MNSYILEIYQKVSWVQTFYISNLLQVATLVQMISQRPAVLSLIHISEPTRQAEISYAVFCLKKKMVCVVGMGCGHLAIAS